VKRRVRHIDANHTMKEEGICGKRVKDEASMKVATGKNDEMEMLTKDLRRWKRRRGC
jgi:hypothetical protein